MKRNIDVDKLKNQRKVVNTGAVLSLEMPGQAEALVELTKSIDGLYEFLNDNESYDFDKLKEQLQLIDRHLDLSDHFKSLESALEAIKPKDTVKATIVDFANLIDAVKANKPIETKVDFTELQKAVVDVRQAIENNSEPESKDASNYTPVRRVIKAGNRFIFDDNMTSSGAGGGGTSISSLDVNNFPGLINFEYDYVSLALTDSDTETYTFKTGGAGGTTVATIVVNYTDSTKDTITDATRT